MNQPGYGQPIPPDWQAFFDRFRLMEQQLQQTASQLESMQKEIAELKNKAPVHVEYHFDQLKVSRLEGTLNIGLTPQGVESMGEFDVQAPGMWSVAPLPQDDSTRRIAELQAEAAGGVERQLPELLQRMAGQLQVPMNEAHLRAIVDDIKKQLNGRVHYYARTTPYPDKGTDAERANWHRAVLEKTKRDVETAVANYLRGLASQEGHPSEGST